MANWGDTGFEGTAQAVPRFSFRCRCGLCDCWNRIIGNVVTAPSDICDQCRRDAHAPSPEVRTRI